MPIWKRNNWDEEVDENYGDYHHDGPKRPKQTFIPHLLGMLFTGVIFLAAVRFAGGQMLFEKTLTSLAAPCGLLWLGLLVLVYFSFLFKYRGAAIMALLCWLFLSLAGNSFVANSLTRYVEDRYLETDVMKMESFDVVFVLGGGTNMKPSGIAQVGGGGDRIVTAARMYHAGKIKSIVCTGSQSLRSSDKDLHPGEESRQILIGLNVPEYVVELPMRGDNTTEEMQNIRKWIDAHPDTTRIGILTSAYHLPRAMRLARSNEIVAGGIPAGYLTQPFSPGPGLLIPSADSLANTRAMFKEIMAGWVGR